MKAISLTMLAFVLFPAIAIAADSGGAAGAPGAASASVADNAGEQINPLARPLPEITATTLPDKPSQAYKGEFTLGTTLSGDFAYYPVTNHDALDYAVLDHKKVIVDRQTRRIVKVIP